MIFFKCQTSLISLVVIFIQIKPTSSGNHCRLLLQRTTFCVVFLSVKSVSIHLSVATLLKLPLKCTITSLCHLFHIIERHYSNSLSLLRSFEPCVHGLENENNNSWNKTNDIARLGFSRKTTGEHSSVVFIWIDPQTQKIRPMFCISYEPRWWFATHCVILEAIN